MSAPLAIEHQAALEQLGRALAAVLASAAERSASDSAAPSRPASADGQRNMHNTRALPTKGDASVEEVNRRVSLTTADA